MNYSLAFVALVSAFLASTQLGFADDEPTVEDAHQFLATVFNAGGVRDNHPSPAVRVLSYEGRRCISRVEVNRDEGVEQLSFDWSVITSANELAGSIFIHGAVAWTMPDGRQGVMQQRQFLFADQVTSRRVSKAVSLLIRRCAPNSKFD